MIEFALLFGLGFLSAALVAILVSPAIHGRIVGYTENRIMATLPISPAELRAQRDMARAVYAAENARIKQELIQARDKTTQLRLQTEKLAETLRVLEGEKLDLKMQVDNLDVEAADARSRIREEDSYIQQLKASLEQSEQDAVTREAENADLQQRLLRATTDADNFRIDLSSRDAEMENLKASLGNLRDERENLRGEIRLLTTRAKDAEARVTQEEQRAARLEERLARETAESADKAEALERRSQELARLRDKLKLATAEAREASRTMRNAIQAQPPTRTSSPRRKAAADTSPVAAIAEPEDASAVEAAPTSANAPARTAALAPAAVALAQDARNRATAVSERLLKSKDGTHDDALRDELAAIAASLVAVTAAAEGSTSPVHTILSGKSGNGERESLAGRAKKTMAALVV